VNAQTDQQLLRDYAGSHSEPAFTELVRRHIDLVYSAARRLVCDAHLAEDVTQGVFVALAQNARQLTQHPVLSGWLHRTTQNLAANAVRTNVRRQAREQEAVAMNDLLSAEPVAHWEQIAPHLDVALGELSEPDRDALLLRYFERKSAREMAQTLGISDEAAQKRVTRAVERLREFFTKRGVTVGASGLVGVITANAVQAAPVGLALTVSTATALTATTLATTATVAATTTIAMTMLQKTIIGATLVAAVGTGIYQTRQTSNLRDELQSLEAQRAGQIQKLEQERNEASVSLATLRAENSRLSSNTADLLKLRGEVARLRAQTQAGLVAEKSLTPDASDATDTQPKAEQLPKETWADVGFATPQKALQTRGWAVVNSNRERFKESVFLTAGARKTLEDLALQMVEKSTDPDKAQYVQQILDHNLGVEDAILFPMIAQNQHLGFTGYNILSTETLSADEMILEVETQMTSAPAKKDTLKFRRYGDDWKVVIDDDFIKKAR
jgi:RNA polymerase sigma factor (sigma-70 family)